PLVVFCTASAHYRFLSGRLRIHTALPADSLSLDRAGRGIHGDLAVKVASCRAETNFTKKSAVNSAVWRTLPEFSDCADSQGCRQAIYSGTGRRQVRSKADRPAPAAVSAARLKNNDSIGADKLLQRVSHGYDASVRSYGNVCLWQGEQDSLSHSRWDA